MRRLTWNTDIPADRCLARLAGSATRDRGVFSPYLVPWDAILARRRGEGVVLRVNSFFVNDHAVRFRIDARDRVSGTELVARVGTPWFSRVLLRGLPHVLALFAGFIVGLAVGGAPTGGPSGPLFLLGLVVPLTLMAAIMWAVLRLFDRRAQADTDQLTRFVEDVAEATPVAYPATS